MRLRTLIRLVLGTLPTLLAWQPKSSAMIRTKVSMPLAELSKAFPTFETQHPIIFPMKPKVEPASTGTVARTIFERRCPRSVVNRAFGA